MHYELAFRDGAAFDGPWGSGLLSVQQVAVLTLTSGQIVARDGLVCNPTPAFSRQVASGRYSVVLCIAEGTVALAMVRFGYEPAVRWEMATLPGQDPAILAADEIFGYPVDAGVGSFLDLDAQQIVEAMSDDEIQTMTDRLMAELFPDGPEMRRWVEQVVDPATGANQVIFSSGMGDDLYSSYWGFAEGGEIVCLVTDFNVSLTVGGVKVGLHESDDA